MTNQSYPAWAGEYGYVATPGQWVAAWQSKQDALPYAPLNSGGGAMTGKLALLASTALSAGLNLGVGTAPNTPAPGDMWISSGGLYFQSDSGTIGPIGPSSVYESIGVEATQGFYFVTCTHGVASLTIGGANFTAANIGNLITIIGIGSAGNELRLSTSIVSCSGSSVTLSATPSIDVSGAYLECFWGSDQYETMQEFISSATVNGVQAVIPPGVYLLSEGLISLPSNEPTSYDNWFGQPASLVVLQQGCTLVAMSGACSPVLTYGGIASDYSEYIRNTIFGGGTIDGNFYAQVGVSVPFALNPTRKEQLVKNTLLNGVQYGSLSAPATTAGSFDFNCSHARDIYTIPVSNIVVSGGVVTVTTARNHGISSGRVVSLSNTNITQVDGNFFVVTTTGVNTNTFTLNNTTGAGWATFNPSTAPSANVAMCMPSSDLPMAISSITLGNPTIINFTNPHGLTGTVPLYFFSVGGCNGLVDGQLSATVTSTTAVTLPVNTTGASSFSGVGWALFYRADQAVESAVNFVNASDADWAGWRIEGVRIGIVGGTSVIPSDGKQDESHINNYPGQGLLFAAVSLGYDNTIMGLQVDTPFIFAFRFTEPRNNLIGCRVNYTGSGLGEIANLSSFVRLESGASVSVIGGGAKAGSSFPLLSTVSVAGMEANHAPGYSQLLFYTVNVTTPQPDMLSGNLVLPDASYLFSSISGGIDAGIQLNATARNVEVFTAGALAATFTSAGYLNVTGGATFGNAINYPSYTVAALPTASGPGSTVFCSNARVSGQGPGAGTGSLVTWNGTAWQIVGTDVTAIA